MPIPKLPDNIKPEAPVFANTFEYINLPFPVLRLNWNNGNPHATGSKLEVPTTYFGGFHRGSLDVKEDLAQLQMDTPPAYFKENSWLNDEGATYMAFSSRTIWCAPIVAKVDWYEGKDRKGNKVKKHRLDFLIYLADYINHVPIAWGLATISAYGNAASMIEKAFKDFAQDTQDARKQWGNNIDARFLWVNIGTFGNERITQKVGKPPDTNIIVPCQFNKPKDGWTDPLLTSMFVGEEIAALILDYQRQAKEWAEDLNSKRQAKKDKTPDAAIESVQIGVPIPENFAEQPNDPFAG